MNRNLKSKVESLFINQMPDHKTSQVTTLLLLRHQLTLLNTPTVRGMMKTHTLSRSLSSRSHNPWKYPNKDNTLLKFPSTLISLRLFE